MKSIVYIVFVILFSSTLITAVPPSTSNQKQIVKIQSIESVKSDLLDESCTIIRKRLENYGIQNFDVSVNTNQKTIELTFSDKVDVNEILPLFTSKGKIEFYETYNRLDVIKLLEKGDTLFSIVDIPSEGSEIKISPAILGYCKPENISRVDSYLARHHMSISGQDVKFLWSINTNKNSDYYLYLLKPDAVLDKSQVLEATESKSNESINLLISFNENGTSVWQSLSKNNMGKPLAIGIDNRVYSAPILKDEITTGTCEISGNFTLNEVVMLKSLINTNELPLEFKLVK